MLPKDAPDQYTGASMRRFSFLFPMIFLLHPQLSASVMPDNDTLDRLENGEILLLDSDTGETDETIRAQAIFHAPAT